MKARGKKRTYSHVWSADTNNDKMHERNIYKENKPDFNQLAIQFPTFAPYVYKNKKGEYNINWKDSDAVRELTKCLLEADFKIKISLPPSQLCPTVTSRVNYIYWLEDLLKLSSKAKRIKLSDEQEKNYIVKGIDIGTGASCIYPLLGTATNQWSFLATDIDPVALDYAKKNVELNQWGDRIELRLVENGKILCGVIKEEECFDFCMCNPPFFDEVEQKIDNPLTICEATENELVTKGGELAFVGQIIEDSLILRERIRWYTSMIGRKVNLKKLTNILREKKIKNFRTTTFYQGKTTRWAVAWSFLDDGMDDLLREHTVKRVIAKGELMFTCDESFTKIIEKIESFLNTNDIGYSINNTNAILANVYETSKWWKTYSNIDTSVNPSLSIGPIMPPMLIFSVQVKVLPLDSKQFSINASFSKSVNEAQACSELLISLKEHILK